MSNSGLGVKLRVEGLPEDVEAALRSIRMCFVVVEESQAYPNRNSKLVRVYVTVKSEPDQEK